MADLYGTSPSSDAEDFSSLINQHLHNTSSVYSSISSPSLKHKYYPSSVFSRFPEPNCMVDFPVIQSDCSVRDVKISAASYENAFSSSGAIDSDTNAPLKRRGLSSENDLGDFSCDSEGGDLPENLSNIDLPRGSSKRSRSAEVHNLSEKRRRRRINEKMKALQNLIPNSNKTDKASMLDEAIEYLKQLQLQVQMLSMRNGLSLQPIGLPGIMQPIQLPQMGFDFDVANAYLTSRRGIDTSPGNEGCPMQSTFDLSNKGGLSDQSIAIPSVPNTTTSETRFGYGPVIQAYDGQFSLSTNFKDSMPKVQSDCPRTGKDSADFS